MRAELMTGFVLAMLVGCSSNPSKEPVPSTHPVRGNVTLPGGKPFTQGGSISFQHDDDAKRGVTTSGEIDAKDGSFTLHSVTAQHKVPGAQEGAHSVTIIPKSTDQSVQPIQLRKKYVIKAGANRLNVEIEK